MNSVTDSQGTIASNIAYGAPEAPKDALERAARQANCDFIWDMPEGFETKSGVLHPHAVSVIFILLPTVGRNSLSGGQRYWFQAAIQKKKIILWTMQAAYRHCKSPSKGASLIVLRRSHFRYHAIIHSYSFEITQRMLQLLMR